MTNKYLEIASAGTHFNLDEFGSVFGECIASASTSFTKVECLQTFHQPENASYNAYMRGDREEAVKLIPGQRVRDRDTYVSLTRKGVFYSRIRLVRRPLSEYLQWEMETYKVTARWGEHISIVDYTDVADQEYFEALRDFLLFDETVVLVNDYGKDGVFRGGWMVNPDDVQEFIKIVHCLRPLTYPLALYEYEVLGQR